MSTVEILLILVCVAGLCFTRIYEVRLLAAHKIEIKLTKEQFDQPKTNDQIEKEHEEIEIEEQARKEQAEMYSSFVTAMQSFMLDTNVEEGGK